MAQDKKSVLLYCDIIHTIEKMDNETAGIFFKHYLRYINDLDPKTDNLIVDIAFESIKQNLKRDLKKWEDKKGVLSNSGSLGNLKRWNVDLYDKVMSEKLTIEEANNIAKSRKLSPPDKNIAVTVNVTDTVNVKDKKNKKSSLSEKETKFLELFNTLKKQKTNKESNIRVLSKTDKSNLAQLSAYTVRDFKIAINNMLDAEWPRINSNQTPTHILRVDNFNKYLEQQISNNNSEETDEQRVARLTKEAKEN